MEKLIKFLEERLEQIQQQLDSIPEEFRNLEDSEDYNYFSGKYDMIQEILNKIKGE